jgi:hypothetical protein
VTAQVRRGASFLLASGVAFVLLALFFQRRGDDVGRLPELVGASLASLLRDPIFGVAGSAAALGGLVAAVAIVLSWLGAGDLVMRGFSRPAAPEPRSLDLATRTLVGAAVWSLVWFVLGAIHLYRAPVAVVAALGGVALGLRAARRACASVPSPSDRPPLITTALIVLVQALALIAALAPPTAKDTLLYHLALPKAYLAAAGFVDTPYNIASYYPLGGEMHSVWAMLLGGLAGQRTAEAAVGATLFAFAPLLALVTYGWARERGADSRWAGLAALAMAAIPSAYDVVAGGYVDLALAAYTALAVRGVGRWWTTLDEAWLSPVVFAIGAGLSIKLTTVVLVLALGLAVLFRALQLSRSTTPQAEQQRSPVRLLVAGFAMLGLGAVLAAPWYLRTWARTGNPVFPFFLTLLGGQAPGWDLERSQLYESMFSVYGGALTPLDFLLSPLRLSVASQMHEPAYYDGVLGVAFAFAGALIAWALISRELDTEIGLALLVSFTLFVFWLFSSQQLRYMLPAVPALAVALAVIGQRAAQALGAGLGRAFWWVTLCVTAAGVPVVVAWFAVLSPVRVVLGGEPPVRFLERRLDYYPYYELVNRDLPATARVWLIHMRRDTYYLDRPYFSDFIFEDWTLREWVRGSASADELAARVRAAGITHILLRPELLLDYTRSPIVDDRRSREENLAKLELTTTFLTRRARRIRGDQTFWLLEVAPSETAR